MQLGLCTYSEVEQLDAYLPYGFININDWIDGRQIAKHRVFVEKLMRELGLTTRHDFVRMARALFTSELCALLGALKDFEYADPGLGYPAWRLASVNRLKGRLIADILA